MFASFKNNLLAGLAVAVAMTSATVSAETVAHYRFEDGSDGGTATQAVDSSGNGNDLTAEVSPVYSSDIPETPIPGTGDPNSLSIDFAGGEHAFSGAEDEGLNAVVFDDITIEAYVNFSDGGGWQNFIGREDSGNQTASDEPMLQFQNTDAGNFRVAWYDRSGSYIGIEAFPVEDDTWYHVAAVGDIGAGTMTLYVDGAEVGSSDAYTGMFAPDPAGTWVIGRGQWAGGASDWSNVKVDEVRFSDAALPVWEFLNFDEPEIEIVRSPANYTAWVGEDVTFVSSANLIAAGELTYQWQISEDGGETWQDIAGATSPSHTITNLGLDADRTHYRAEISFEDLTEVTDSAYLRVGEGPAPAAQEGVLAHYRFEEGSDGGTATGAIDSSGNGFDMDVLGEPAYSSEVPRSAIGQTGDANDLSVDFGATTDNYAFQGVDDEGLSNEPIDDFTVEAYVNFSEIGGWQTFVGRDDTGNQTNDNHAIFYMQNRGDGNTFGVSWVDREGNVVAPGLQGPVVEPNRWYHVAAVADLSSETIVLYVNGVEVDRNEEFPGLLIPESPTTNWSIGRGQWAGGDSDWVNGRMDEVRISNRPLLPSEFLGFGTAALTFAFHPEDVTAFVGDEITFSALAAGGGTDPLSYQWQVSEDDGETWSDVSGATDSSYTFAPGNLDEDGKMYRVVASRGDDSETSGTATLSVPDYPDPRMVDELVPDSLFFEGEDVTYSVEATGVGNITYQWHQDGTDIAGETGTTLSFDSVTTDLDGTVISVTVTDDGAEAEGLDAKSVTFSTVLSVAPRLKRAISLNFVGTSDDGTTWSDALGVIDPDELAGAVPVGNWNNSATESAVSTQETPVDLVDDMGEATSASAIWSANNTWAARMTAGPVSEKDPDQRLFHGYIETRAGVGDTEAATTVTIEGIPYDTYDVYVYPMGVEGGVGQFGRSVTMEDENGVRELFMMNLFGNPTPEEIPYVLSHATSVEEARDSHLATHFRFAGASGPSVTLQHFDIDGNAGGFGAVSIVDTTPSTPARPAFVQRPADQLVPGGDDAVLSVSAESYNEGGSLSYQWRKDGVDLSGETGATLTIENASGADAGQYTVVVTDTSNLGSSINTASASLIVVDESRFALLNVDMDVAGDPMSGNGMLLPDGLQDWVAPNGEENPMGIGEGDAIWNSLGATTGTTTYEGLVDSEGLTLPGVTFTVAGATGAEDDVDGGGLESLQSEPTYSAPLLRDYVFTEGEDEITLTVGGLSAFAGREVTLVVYALGKDSRDWLNADDPPVEPDQDDEATVTLAEANNEFGLAPVATDQQGGEDNEGGREIRWNDQSFAAFDARVAANGTVSWTVGPVAGEPGLNAFDGFQILITNQGDPIEPEGIADWRQTHFGSSTNEGDAANDADPDGDGFLNLVEYALGTDPTVAGDGQAAVSRGQDGDFLTLTFDHIADSNLSYAIEATNDLNGTWAEVQNYGSFATAGTQTFTDSEAISANPNRFLRLKVTVTE